MSDFKGLKAVLMYLNTLLMYLNTVSPFHILVEPGTPENTRLRNFMMYLRGYVMMYLNTLMMYLNTVFQGEALVIYIVIYIVTNGRNIFGQGKNPKTRTVENKGLKAVLMYVRVRILLMYVRVLF